MDTTEEQKPIDNRPTPETFIYTQITDKLGHVHNQLSELTTMLEGAAFNDTEIDYTKHSILRHRANTMREQMRHVIKLLEAWRNSGIPF